MGRSATVGPAAAGVIWAPAGVTGVEEEVSSLAFDFLADSPPLAAPWPVELRVRRRRAGVAVPLADAVPPPAEDEPLLLAPPPMPPELAAVELSASVLADMALM